MKKKTRNMLNELRQLIQPHPGLKKYQDANGRTAAARFWNLLRVDLMRLAPDEIETYLVREDIKLVEVEGLGQDLAEVIKRDPPHGQEALIYACVEMDAAWKMANVDSPKLKTLADQLTQKLDLWRAL